MAEASEVTVIEPGPPPVPTLTVEEDTFALAVIEYGGNLYAAIKAAFPECAAPLAKARELLSRPEVAIRVKQISQVIDEHALISLGSHLNELAKIRDLAVTSGQLKTALGAEVQRGKVAGFYDAVDDGGGRTDNPGVVINMGAGSSVSVSEWSKKHGKGNAPLIIDAKT